MSALDAMAEHVQRENPDGSGRRTAQGQPQPGLRMDDGTDVSVVFGRAPQRGLYLGRVNTGRHCRHRRRRAYRIDVDNPPPLTPHPANMLRNDNII